MYFYLYDAFLRDKKYERTLAKIEGRLLELGILGKSEKLTLLKSMRDVVKNAIKRGADTIVAVGDDQTVSKIITHIADEDVILGIIPLGSHTKLAASLGIPRGVAACDILSSRIVERIDLGKANDAFFVSFLELAPSQELLLECDQGAYHIEPDGKPHAVFVYNFGAEGRDPRDGMLELVVRSSGDEKGGLFRKGSGSTPSLFPVRHVKIKSFGRSVAAHADGQTVVKTPMTVQVIPKKLRVIVGKNRGFA